MHTRTSPEGETPSPPPPQTDGVAPHHVHQALCHLRAVLEGPAAASLRPAALGALADLAARLLWISEELHGGVAPPPDAAAHRQIEQQIRRLQERPVSPALRCHLGALLLDATAGLLGKDHADRTTLRLVGIARERLLGSQGKRGGLWRRLTGWLGTRAIGRADRP